MTIARLGVSVGDPGGALSCCLLGAWDGILLPQRASFSLYHLHFSMSLSALSSASSSKYSRAFHFYFSNNEPRFYPTLQLSGLAHSMYKDMLTTALSCPSLDPRMPVLF